MRKCCAKNGIFAGKNDSFQAQPVNRISNWIKGHSLKVVFDHVVKCLFLNSVMSNVLYQKLLKFYDMSQDFGHFMGIFRAKKLEDGFKMILLDST